MLHEWIRAPIDPQSQLPNTLSELVKKHENAVTV